LWTISEFVPIDDLRGMTMESTYQPAHAPLLSDSSATGSRVDAMYRLLLLLADGPDQFGFLAGLVHSVLPDDQAHAAALATISPAGHVYVTSCYGMALDEVSSRLGASVWHDTPLTSVVRSGRPWLGMSEAAHGDGCDAGGPGRFCLALPIHRWGFAMGVLFITADRQPDLAADGPFWMGVAAACTGFLPHAQATAERLRPRAVMSPSTQPRLNDRDMSILRLVAEGRNNGQIGRELGYSLSTIAHALVAIYRELGVSTRQDAVEAAISMGLLDMDLLDMGSAPTPRPGPRHDQGSLAPSGDRSPDSPDRMTHRLAVGSPPRSRAR
jgi:DNA-binding CsgD family transcriptional regulator